ncbi:GNAT family N-acetyltransferase [Streptomyces seoulensis]|nr:GNAT family N-acetyltransferase [Streptomyces seoulensis]
MASDGWYLTTDLDDFLARARQFLHSRPVQHTVPLTVTENLRTAGAGLYGDRPPEFGVLREGGGPGARAVFIRTPPHPLTLTALTVRDADDLADRLAGAGHELPGVNADRDTAAAFAAAWQRRTGTGAVLARRMRLYRLGELTAPRPAPPGHARTADGSDRELLGRWFGEFHTAIGERAGQRAEDWADRRIRRGDVLLWQTPDGTPAAMAGLSPEVAGQVRVLGVYTPAHLRGRGYAGAVTAEVSRSASAAGATEVLLFTDLANPTSNSLYQRIGYRPVSDFARYYFA